MTLTLIENIKSIIEAFENLNILIANTVFINFNQLKLHLKIISFMLIKKIDDLMEQQMLSLSVKDVFGDDFPIAALENKIALAE